MLCTAWKLRRASQPETFLVPSRWSTSMSTGGRIWPCPIVSAGPSLCWLTTRRRNFWQRVMVDGIPGQLGMDHGHHDQSPGATNFEASPRRATPGHLEHPELLRPHPPSSSSHEATATASHEPHGTPEHTHDRHEGHSVEMFRARFWVSLILTAPTLALGHMIPSALGLEPPSFPGSAWIPPILGTLVFAYGGGRLPQRVL